jgi:hypothetical protein
VRPNPELALLREGTSSRSNRTDTYQLSQPIEMGGKRGARIKLAEQDQALARGDVNVAAAELRANVTAAYLEALTAQEHVALAKESLSLAGRLPTPLAAAWRPAKSRLWSKPDRAWRKPVRVWSCRKQSPTLHWHGAAWLHSGAARSLKRAP